jgi:hypothetical protein
MRGAIDTNELASFLSEANANTYANKSAAKAAASRLASEDYRFERGDLIFHDTYFGVRDFIGSRGRQSYRADEWSYTNAPDGEISQFTGSEEIHKAGQLAYRAYSHGGLVK